MGQIIHILTEDGAKCLQRNEVIIFIIFVVLVLSSITVSIYNKFPLDCIICEEILLLKLVLVLSILNLVFFPFVYFFRMYHRSVYNQLKVNIWIFYLFETVFSLLLIEELIYDLPNPGIVPIQQSMCLLILKSIQDPL